MRERQLYYRSFITRRVSCIVLFLGCIALAPNGTLAQQRILSPEQPQQSHTLNLQFSGEQPRPLTMISGDFDEDGVADLVIGYGLEKGGSIALLRGNLDAIAPQTEASWLAAGRHEYSDPFLQPSKMTTVSTQPNMMISADVNGDGHLDLVYATKGRNQLNVMLGDGKGNFLKPFSTQVPGGITALAAYRPGPPVLGEAVIVGYESSRGARLGILSLGATGMSMKTTYGLPGPATALTVASLDADFIPDTAIVAGGQLMVLHGQNALSGGGRLETLPVISAEAVAAGDFLFDRHFGVQLSVLTSNGEALILAHEGFDPQPYTPQQIAQLRHDWHRSKGASAQQDEGGTGNAPWIVVKRKSELALRSYGSDAPILLRSRTSGSGGDDLVVLNPSQQQRVVISHSFAPSRASGSALTQADTVQTGQSRIAVRSLAPGNVVGALSMRVSPDGRAGLVLLHGNNPSPEILDPAAGRTFYVNTTADNLGTTTDPDDGTRCTVNGSSPTCTLRDAVVFANDDAADNISAGKSDTIMFTSPSGTYSLTWQSLNNPLDSNGNAIPHLEILGPVTIMGGTGTVINGDQNDTIFTINPGLAGYYSAIGANNGSFFAFDVTLENLTLENGLNQNNPANSPTGNYNNFGGCVNWIADGTGNLTITNSTIENCKIIYGQGGAIWGWNAGGVGAGALILTNDTISNNKTSEQGGAVYMFGGNGDVYDPVMFTGGGLAVLTATNTTFNGNLASVTVNTSPGGDPGGAPNEGDGGALYINPRGKSSGTPQSTLSNVTIMSNTADGDGGGIYTNSGIMLSNSLVQSNASKVVSSTISGDQYLGGGFYIEVGDPETAATITSTNFLNNSATTSGGGIFVGPDNPLSGPPSLQISLSRIFGNTSTSGTTGLGTGSPGQATATNNWWGCNAGPGNTGCDGAGSGATTSQPAQLDFTSDITTIPQGGSMNLTVTMGSGITGAFPAVATNYPYTYNVTGVTANPPLTSGTFNTSGVGTAALTPSTTGIGKVTVTFDNQTDTINFTAEALTATSLAISPASPAFSYGQPGSLTVQLTPSNATGITTSDFTVQMDGSSAGYGLTLISNNNYRLMGPFNSINPAVHSLKVSFVGTGNYAATNTSVNLTVLAGSVAIGDTITPPKPVQGQGGTINVTVNRIGTGATPMGTLTYALDGGTTTTVTLNSSGAAAITIPTTITTGSHTATLNYNGDTNYAAASITAHFTIYGRSQTTIAAITSTTATIDVFGFGFTPPSGQLDFTDVTLSSPAGPPVTLNTSTATTSLLPQVTNGTGANTLPDWTTLGDINGDGKQDLVTSLYTTDSVSVQLGNGDGTFQPATTTVIAAGFGPAECQLVSLRGNGILDLIVGSFNLNEIAVLLGNGNGTFETPTFYDVGTATNTPTSLTTGDFNHDGKLDVAVANTGDNTVSILLGNGTGALTPLGSPISVGRVPQAIRAGDFNDDGYSDLAVANHSDGTVTTLLNNQAGGFTKKTVSVGSGAGSGPQALAIHGSGSLLLLAVANYYDNTVSIMKSNGSGGFGAQTIVPVGVGPDDVNFADFNGDGLPDLVVSNYTSGSVSLLLKKLVGGYSVLGPFNVGNKPYSAAVGDLDLDGTPDIVVSNSFSNNTGTLLSGTQISVPYTGLSLNEEDTFNASYSPDANSKYGGSTSRNLTLPTTTLTLSNTSFDFGGNLVNNTLTKTVVTVTNTGNNPATLNPTLSGNPSFSIVANQSCGAHLAASASCNVVVAYLPTSASSPTAQTAMLNLNPGNVTSGTPSMVSITGTSAVLMVGRVTTTNNPQVAQYTITLPFPGGVTISFGTTTGYGLQTWTKTTPTGDSPVSIYVAGMRANTLYHMQASIQFDNGLTVTDSDHTFTTSSYPAGSVTAITATTNAGQTPQPGVEILNPTNGVSQVMASDLSGNILWAYISPTSLSPSAIEGPKLMPNGDFLLPVGVFSATPLQGPIPPTSPNFVREVDLAGNTVKEITMAQLNARLVTAGYNLTLQTFHHDAEPLPNGHWLVLANTLKSVTFTGSSTPTTVLGDVIVDLDSNLNPVWVWNEFDHLDVNRRPTGGQDWTHSNAVIYSPDDGNILVSIRHQSWVVKVDYQNGAGTGNILWRLGYQGDFKLGGGTDPTDWFYGQHGPHFTTANTSGTFGLILMDNGDFRIYPSTDPCTTTVPEPASCLYTTVPIFQIDEVAKTATLQFHQILPTSLYSNFGGNAETLANGNVEYDLCGLPGPEGGVFEVTNENTPQPVLNMRVPVFSYRWFRLPSLYPGVQW